MRKETKRAYMRLSKRGILEPSERHKGGSAISKVPKALYDPKTKMRQFLDFLEIVRDLIGLPLGQTDLAKLCKDNGLVLPLGTVNKCLSKFDSLKLVTYTQINRSGGVYILKTGNWQDNLQFTPKQASNTTELGAYLRAVPVKRLRDPKSIIRRVLAILSKSSDLQRPKRLETIYYKRHGLRGFANRKSLHDSITRVLSEAVTLGLVDRIPRNKRANVYRLKTSIDLADIAKLIALCEANLSKLKKHETRVSRLPMHGEYAADLVRESSQ